MSTPAQIAANIANAQLSTGPRSEDGRAISSQNAVKSGLFAAHDFIGPGEQSIYAELENTLDSELAPAGTIEFNLVQEILSAMWRLRRCRVVEEALATQLAATVQRDTQAGPLVDPIQNDATAKLQLSVDRARSQANRLLHKCTFELRRLQTERHYRNEVLPGGFLCEGLGICDFAEVVKGAGRAAADQRRQKMGEMDELLAGIDLEARSLAANSHLTKQTQPAAPAQQKPAPKPAELARNAPCPCKSGQKYKRCCGRNALPWMPRREGA